MQILTAPHPTLSQKCSRVDKVTDELRQTCLEMQQLLSASGGLGLAAPQVGIPLRFFILTKGDQAAALFNPYVVSRSGENTFVEGCLSLPGTYVPVKRSNTVTVAFLDYEGKVQRETFNGLAARIIEHEIDHLDGILITDR